VIVGRTRDCRLQQPSLTGSELPPIASGTNPRRSSTSALACRAVRTRYPEIAGYRSSGTQFDVEVNARNVTEVDVVDGLVESLWKKKNIKEDQFLLEPGFSTRMDWTLVRNNLNPPTKFVRVERT